jgi:hypothetical protein
MRRDAELLAGEPGCEDYDEREVDDCLGPERSPFSTYSTRV